MTINSVMTYFDNKTKKMAYLLGTDNLGSANLQEGNEIFFPIEKVFVGKNSLGISRGVVPAMPGVAEEIFNFNSSGYDRFSTLENKFDDIHEGKDYSHLDFVKYSSGYVFFVAKISPSSIDLYTISNMRDEGNNLANPVHSISSLSHFEESSKMFYAPYSYSFVHFNFEKMFSLEEALPIMKKSLNIPEKIRNKLDDAKPEVFNKNIYSVTFDGFKKIK